MYVLVDEALLVGLDKVAHFNRLRNHRGDDGEELGRALVVAVGLVAEVNAERADGAAVDEDGDRDEGQLLLLERAAAHAQAVEEERLAADLRDDDGLAGLDDAARDALADLVARASGQALVHAVRGGDVEVAHVAVEEDDRCAHRVVMTPEQAQDARHRVAQLESPGQRLARLQKRRQFARLSLFRCHLRGSASRALLVDSPTRL